MSLSGGWTVNVSELEAVLKGLTLALKWRRTKIRVVTDSACVHGWLRSVVGNTCRPKVSGLSEMIVRRRLTTVLQLIEEYGIELSVDLVPSNKNIADNMTRVPKQWLHQKIVVGAGVTENLVEKVTELHNLHHLGVD